MDRRTTIALGTTALLGFGLALSGSVVAQQKSLKEQLVGSWTFVSGIDTRPDGTKNDRWGPNPKGSLMFDATGRFTQIISRSDLPKFAGNKPDQGTADENKAVLSGMTVSFGTYSVNEAEKTITTRVEGGMYPNLIGLEQNRIISLLTADELKYTNPTATSGASAAAQWKRVK